MNAFTLVLLYAVGMLALVYFLMILPGKKKNKKMQELHNAVAAGDEIVTIGGIVGTVVERDEDTVTVKIDKNGTCVKLLIYAVQTIKRKHEEG